MIYSEILLTNVFLLSAAGVGKTLPTTFILALIDFLTKKEDDDSKALEYLFILHFGIFLILLCIGGILDYLN